MNKKDRQVLPVTYEEDSHDSDATVIVAPGEGSERPLPTCEKCDGHLTASDIQLGLKVCFWCDMDAWTFRGKRGEES